MHYQAVQMLEKPFIDAGTDQQILKFEYSSVSYLKPSPPSQIKWPQRWYLVHLSL